MNKLGTLYDSVAKMDYSLYAMPYQELKTLVVSGMTLSEEQVIRFDSESEFFRPDWGGKRALELKQTTRIRHAEIGLEQMPFILSYQSEKDRYVLLDGFNRLFGSHGTFTQDVLVKVYEDITPKDWVNIMTHANAWKVSKSGGVAMMDRGFKLSLFEHYGIDLAISPIGDEREEPLRYQSAFSTYFNREPFDTLLDSERFLDDARLLIQLLMTDLTFHHKTKKVDEWMKSNEYDMKRYAHSFEQLKQILVIVLGSIRRKEIREGWTQAELTMDDVLAFYQRDDLQKHFVKVTQMQVPGHIENYIKKHLKVELEAYLMEKMGHNYTAPAPKVKAVTGGFKITDDMV